MQWLWAFVTVLQVGFLRVMSRVEFSLARRQSAQGLVEYGLILVLIAITCVAVVTILGRTISGVWYNRLISAWPS